MVKNLLFIFSTLVWCIPLHAMQNESKIIKNDRFTRTYTRDPKTARWKLTLQVHTVVRSSSTEIITRKYTEDGDWVTIEVCKQIGKSITTDKPERITRGDYEALDYTENAL